MSTRSVEDARPFVEKQPSIHAADSDSGNSGGEGSCSGDSSSGCPSGYMPHLEAFSKVETRTQAPAPAHK